MFEKHYRHNNDKKIIGASIVGMAMGVLFGMLLSSKKGKEQVDKAAHWSQNMAEDLNKRVEDMRELSADKYNNMVDEVSVKYRKLKGIKESEVDDFVDELKMRWDRIKDQWNS